MTGPTTGVTGPTTGRHRPNRRDGGLGPQVPDGAISWLATMIGIAVVGTAGMLPLFIALPIGVIGIAVSTVVLIGAGSHQGRGAGYGVAGLVLTSVGLIATLGLSIGLAITPGLPIPEPVPSTGEPPPTDPLRQTPVAIRLQPAAITASATAPPVPDGQGNTLIFDPKHVLDGDPTTAWAAVGDGVGNVITVSFGRPIHLAGMGVLVGYSDSGDFAWIDYFGQIGRVSSARFTVDHGRFTDHTFVDFPQLQQFEIAADTTSLQITILSSTSGTRDLTAISEVEFYGWEN